MEKTVYNGKFIKVTEEEIEGKTYERAYVIEPIIILPFNEKGELLIIKEKRLHEKPKIRWKLVTGVYEKDVSLEENVNRELQEEIGKKASKIKHYLTVKTTGTLNEVKRYFIATGLIDSKIPNPDGEDSIIKVKPLSLEKVVEKTLKGKLSTGTTGYVLLKLYHDIIEGKISIE
ncbi:MAG: NUDIX domain-containing protein [Nanoarchaeota archaeon]|nr:NUDIX domain-containing protein [Nanoarchaeota archaeon]